MTIKPWLFRRIMNLWPPFLFNSIKVTHISDDWRSLHVRLRLRPWNRNYVKTHFGGNLFSMTDPMWMIMLIHNLGSNYYVWDKIGEIEFIAPGRETVFAEFSLTQQTIDQLLTTAANGEKVLHWFQTDIKTAKGELIARVRKQIYLRRKPERT